MDLFIENVQIGEQFDNSNSKFESDHIPNLADEKPHSPSILLVRGDSLSVAEIVADSGGRRGGKNIPCDRQIPCVLNFANNDVPGGPYSIKGTTQEEILLKRTTLGGALDKKHYPIDDVEDHYQYWQYKKLGLIYSPRVYVIRDEEYNLLSEPRHIAVITCAAINNPRTTGNSYTYARDREITRRKIEMILDTAVMQGHNNLIAGQWGCGAFGNPMEICTLWIEAIARRNIKVVFPIFDNAFGDTMRELVAKMNGEL